MKRRLRSAGVSHNDRLFGIAASGGMNEATLLTILARLPPGITEIYMHPAVQSGRAITESMHGYRHAEELAALMSPGAEAYRVFARRLRWAAMSSEGSPTRSARTGRRPRESRGAR